MKSPTASPVQDLMLSTHGIRDAQCQIMVCAYADINGLSRTSMPRETRASLAHVDLTLRIRTNRSWEVGGSIMFL